MKSIIHAPTGHTSECKILSMRSLVSSLIAELGATSPEFVGDMGNGLLSCDGLPAVGGAVEDRASVMVLQCHREASTYSGWEVAHTTPTPSQLGVIRHVAALMLTTITLVQIRPSGPLFSYSWYGVCSTSHS